MIKKLLLLAALAGVFLTVCPRAAGQSQTTVSATVTDPNGIPYAGGTVKITLSPPGAGSPCVVTGSNCVPIPSTVGPQLMDSTGSFTVNLYPNASILCGGQACTTQWTFNVCTVGAPPPLGTGPQCFSLAITIAGSSQSVTAALIAIAPRLSTINGSGGGTGTPGAPVGSMQTNLGGGNFGGSTMQFDPVGNIFSGTFSFDFSGVTLLNLPAFLNTNAATASALQNVPSGCAVGQFATGVDAGGNAICATPTGSGTVNTGLALQPAFYASNGTAVSPISFPGTIPNGTQFSLSWLSNNSGAVASVSMLPDSFGVNPQSGAGYTLQSNPGAGNSDLESLITLSNAAPQQFNFCNLGTTTGCGQGFFGALLNLGSAAWTLKPNGTQTVNGGASLNFSEFVYAPFVADTATNWRVARMPTIDKLDTEAGSCSGATNATTWNSTTEQYGCNSIAAQPVVIGATPGGTATPSGTQFGPVQGAWSFTSAAVASIWVAPRAGTLSHFFAHVSAAEGASATLQFTVQSCTPSGTPHICTAASSTITCTIPNSDNFCSDVTHTLAVNAGDYLVIQTVQTGTGTAAATSVSMEFN